MQKIETIENKTPEVVTVDGIQFKSYQYELLRCMVTIRKEENVNEIIKDLVLKGLLMELDNLEGDYAKPIREKFKEDGYESELKKEMALTGPHAEVLLSNIKTDRYGWSDELIIRDECISSMSVAGIWRRTVKRVASKKD